MNTPSPKEAQIKEQYDNTEPSGKAEQDAIKEAPDWLEEVLSQLHYKGLIDARRGNPIAEAKAAIAQHIAEQVEAARIEELEEMLGQQDHEGKPLTVTTELVKSRLAKLRRET